MTLEEAIEELERISVPILTVEERRKLLAVRLGIEALKLIQYQSPNRTLPGTKLLPGETKE
jgi:hypothetical protein